MFKRKFLEIALLVMTAVTSVLKSVVRFIDNLAKTTRTSTESCGC